VRFMIDKVSLEQVFPLSLIGFPLPVTIPPLFHIHLSLLPEMCSSPDEEELSSPHCGASSLTLYLAGCKVRKVFFLRSVSSFSQSFVFGFWFWWV
jgi:hypothetical protein